MTLLRHFTFSLQKPFAKNIVNGIFWVFIGFGVYLLLLAQESSWQYPRFQGIISFLSAFFIALPVLVYRSTRLRNFCRRRFLYVSEMLVAIPLGLNGLGALYFFDNGSWGYDSFAHFASSFMAVFLIFLVISGLTVANTIFTRTLFFFVAVTGAFFAGIVMELWEWSADLFFGTRTWGEMGQAPLLDTASDLFYDALGVAFGALFLFFVAKNLLVRLRRITPRVHYFAQVARDHMEDTVRQKIVKGKERIQTIRAKHSRSFVD